ncbi:hypothetical protein M422DRAFT_163272, partial [Sphaerobolus stellatus SS14]
ALPTAAEVQATLLNINNIQGDILFGMKKNMETFLFFSIANSTLFKQKLRADIKSRVTSTAQLLSVSSQPVTALNVAFLQAGLNALGVIDDLSDFVFSGGQESDAGELGDPGTINWVPAFKGSQIHGVFLLASDTSANLNSFVSEFTAIVQDSIHQIYRLDGAARPGAQAGHEHFGFMDGISQPAIDGFNKALPGQESIPPGIILLGEERDSNSTSRPDWAKGGSFLAFRQLAQKVPEFNQYLVENAIVAPGLTREQGSELLGARMVGRWKSGAPIDLAPKFDDPVLARDPNRNNNFTFAHPDEDIISDQTRCPFSAHIRKTKPRADSGSSVNVVNQIIRAGIPYGPEVTRQEATSKKTIQERGLAFVAYQSAIGDGFQFLQQAWANQPLFPFGKSDRTPGYDPIVGANSGQTRFVSGLDPNDANHDYTMETDFVVSRGGEYFFSPPISALSDVLSVGA